MCICESTDYLFPAQYKEFRHVFYHSSATFVSDTNNPDKVAHIVCMVVVLAVVRRPSQGAEFTSSAHVRGSIVINQDWLMCRIRSIFNKVNEKIGFRETMNKKKIELCEDVLYTRSG